MLVSKYLQSSVKYHVSCLHFSTSTSTSSSTAAAALRRLAPLLTVVHLPRPPPSLLLICVASSFGLVFVFGMWSAEC